MKFAYALAFGALALAQPAPEEPCESVVTETEYAYVTFCPCSESSLSESSTSSSTSPGGGVVGPTLTNGEGTTSSTTTTTPAPPPSGTPSSSSESVIIDTVPPIISESSSSTISIAPPPLTSVSGSSGSPPPVVSTSVTTTPSVPPPPSTVAPAGTTQTLALSAQGDYQTRALFAHNVHRANSSIPLLVWNATQAGWAQELAQTCVYGHSKAAGDHNYGQNIGAGFTADEIPVMITNSMYNGEINFYPGPYGANNIDESNFPAWGHFSQILWRDTISVGCFTADCSATGLANTGNSGVRPLFTVCNYYPPGNFQGQWSKVAQPLGGGSVIFR